MRHDRVGVPATAAEKCPGIASVRVVQLNPIGIYAEERPRAILLASEEAGLVAGEVLKHFADARADEVDPTTGTHPKEIGKADAAPGSAVVDFGIVKEGVGVGGEVRS